ncbi:S10 family peptidase [Rhodoplanes sp. Z2-YC6860]|uniref:S10 family peptidase n=1 Tax=Rhodoplanes sp. Z2-YC6860 TaxID=674703 RepID=UPI0008338212|nr:carboxypeptidase [Rhodoplanes sp. Z2-YC6860]
MRIRPSLLALATLLTGVLAAPDLLVPGLMAQERPAQERSAQERPARNERPAQHSDEAQAAGPGVLRLLPPDAVSSKEITVDGRTIAYTATAGTLPLFDQSGERTASVYYTAYIAKGADAGRRPITFAFNGGPGAASAYLNLGVVGPRIAEFGADNRDGSAVRLVDNPDTWFAFTDLVMIDPIGTGWSRTAKPDAANGFWGVRSDASVMAKVIALYVARNSRGASPKYLLGESYGGFRAAKVAGTLQHEQGIVTSGIIMLSPLLETSFQWGGSQTALGAALHFPTLAAAEMDRTKSFTPEKLAEAERFALTDYLSGLAGPRPSGEKAKSLYGRIAELTGLKIDVVEKSRGWVRNAYLNHLRDLGVTVSSYDATFAVPDPYPESDRRRGSDPILDGFTRALSGAYVAYARDELGFKTDMTYNLLAGEVASKWEWGDRREQPGVSDDLRELLSQTPSFRLLVAHGRTDLVTPYGVSRYVLDHLPEIGGPNRVQLKLYRGGHMFYFNPDSRHAFAQEAKSFYQAEP